MITTEEAISIVLNSCPNPTIETISIFDSLGRVIAEDVKTDRPFPPFDRVMMDGIAIRFQDFNSGTRKFLKEGISFAGDPQKALEKENSCLEVMTGSVMPENADVIVPYEQISETNDCWCVNTDSVCSMQNIHQTGTDYLAQTIVIQKGQKIGTPEIAVLTSVGKVQVKVTRKPLVCIISTGNELVEPDKNVSPHQIRSSNKYQLSFAMEQIGIEAELFHLNDSLEDLTLRLKEIINQFDIIVTSGGVSKGKKDFLPQAFDQLKIEKKFHRVKQRPGKPFWFGNNNDTFIFALPGNPVSTAVCAYRYLVPFIRKFMLFEHQMQYVVLTEAVDFKPALTMFMPVKITNTKNGVTQCTPQKGNGSGDLINLTTTDGFIELDDKRNNFNPGDVFPFYPWTI